MLRAYKSTSKLEKANMVKVINLSLRVPVTRKIAKKYSTISLSEASEFLQSPFHEERLFALFILIDLFRRADEEDKKKIYDLYLKNTNYINNWDLVDASAVRIVGAYLFTHDKKPIYDLAKSKNLWERRKTRGRFFV